MEELEREMQQAQNFEEEQALCMQLDSEASTQRRPLAKVLSLPSDFTYSSPIFERQFSTQRRQTLQNFGRGSRYSDFGQSIEERTSINEMPEIELGEMKPNAKPKVNNVQKEIDRRLSSASCQTPRSGSIFEREKSIDDRQTTPKPIKRDTNRCSSDQFILNNDYKTTNFYQKPIAKQNEKNATKNFADKLATSKDSIVMGSDNGKTTLYRRSSLKFDYGNSHASNTLHLLPKAQSVGRSGSCRQLFKQHAMDDDADIDENSLLLPVLNKSQPQLDGKNGKETSLFTKPNNETN